MEKPKENAEGDKGKRKRKKAARFKLKKICWKKNNH